MIITPAPARRFVEHVMGMPISLALRGRHAADERGAAAWAAAMSELREADAVFSIHRPDSAICRLGRGEIILADCPPEVGEVLALGEVARADSGGAFDVWRGGSLDPSGVVKGWAAQRAATHLWELPGTDFCLSAGGDIVCHTHDPDGAPWQIGIEDPHDPDRLVDLVPMHTGAMATSGAARRGANVVDARTGRDPVGVASVTVIGTSLTGVAIDATAAYALGREAARWLRTRDHASALVIHSDRTATVVTRGPRARPRLRDSVTRT